VRITPLFVVIYVASAVLAYPVLTPEETAGFERERLAKQFRVMAFRDGKPIPITLAALSKPDPTLRFLLAGNEVQLPGGDLHQAVLIQKSGDWQLVEYRYANTVDSTSRYRAYADRIEPISHRVTLHPGLLIAFVLLALPVWLVAFVAAWVWRRYRAKGSTERR
jgi:hypothetical protein